MFFLIVFHIDKVLGTYPEITKDLIEKGIFQEFWKRQDLISKNGPSKSPEKIQKN